MRAITIQQPWAWAVIFGGKRIENRTRIGTWRKAVGETIAVHAGQRWSTRGAASDLIGEAAVRVGPALPILVGHPSVTPFGAVIGLVDVTDVHPEQGGCCAPWGETSYVEHGGGKRVDIVHLVLANPVPVLPVDCKGVLGLWTLPDDVVGALADEAVAADA